jgi:hypothetical protein
VPRLRHITRPVHRLTKRAEISHIINPMLDLADLGTVLDEIAAGTSLREACRQRNVDQASLRRRLMADADLAPLYAKARELQAHSLADRIVDESLRDDLDPQTMRARIEGLKWAASKLLPRVYGDRQIIEHDISDRLAERLEAAQQRLELRRNAPLIEASATISCAEDEIQPPATAPQHSKPLK